MDGWVMIKTELDTKLIDKQIKALENELVDLEKQYEEVSTNKMFEWQEEEARKLRKEINRVNEEIDTLEGQRLKVDMFGNMKNSIDGIGDGITKIVKKVARWGVAIFGVRSAYMAVRSAMGTISENDEQLKADIDYIKDALAYTLEPVVRRIVDLIKQLMFYVAYLTKAWTGKNIFENANKSLKGANKQAKDLKKTMAGFDEMNVLTDNSSSSGGGATTPSFDLTGIENMEEPKWLIMIRDIGQWIIDNWQEVIFGLLLTKLFIDLLTGNWIGVIIDLIGLLVIAFFKIKDAIIVIWENGKIVLGQFVNWIYDKVIKPIGEWFANLWTGIKQGASNLWEGIKEVFTTIWNWIYKNFIKPMGDFFGSLWNGLVIGFEKAINGIKNAFNSVVNFFKNIINTIVGLFKTIGTKVGDVLGSAFKAVINGVLKAIENILNFPIKSINKLIDVINKVPGIDLGKLPTFNLPRLAVGGIVNMPSRGVPIGGAIAGEAGAEGVIPLTDSQAMETLGQAIGKYITINANITNTMNGRVISRELQKVNSSSDFAFNR